MDESRTSEVLDFLEEANADLFLGADLVRVKRQFNLPSWALVPLPPPFFSSCLIIIIIIFADRYVSLIRQDIRFLNYTITSIDASSCPPIVIPSSFYIVCINIDVKQKTSEMLTSRNSTKRKHTCRVHPRSRYTGTPSRRGEKFRYGVISVLG